MARLGGRAGHHDAQWSTEVVNDDVNKGCGVVSKLLGCENTEDKPGTVNVLRNARIMRMSHITSDATPYKNDMENATTNKTILETGKFVCRRMARGTGSVGTVTKIEGIPNIKVMTDKTIQQVTRDLDGCVTSCSAS